MVIGARRVARNSAFYFASLVVPAVAAVALVPVTVRALVPARFGLLALAWAIAEGTGMFDFGLGRATIRFVADATTRTPERVKEVVLASLWSQVTAGLVGGTMLFALSPLLVTRVFHISRELFPEAIAMLRILALHIPVLFAAASLRASLEGAQRFEISAALRIPGTLASVAIPAIVASLGYSLPTIMWWLLAVRMTLVIAGAVVVSRVLLDRKWGVPSGWHTLREMLRYSGWVAVSVALGPLLGSLDRFTVGALAGVSALGFYTGAAEAANRFLLIPATAFSALLPALAATDAYGARDRALAATRAARRQLAAVLFPLCFALFAFAPYILGVWLGPAFSAKAGTALRILSIGVFFGGLAHLPMALLYGSNRPDLPARIHVGEILLYIPLTLFLVRMWGISGGAAAWALRCAADLALYELATRRAIGRYTIDLAERKRTLQLTLAGIVLATIFGLSAYFSHSSWPIALLLLIPGLATYTIVGWSRVLSPSERRAWTTTIFPSRGRTS